MKIVILDAKTMGSDIDFKPITDIADTKIYSSTSPGQVAERIIETAKENEVPLYADDKLASTLSKLEIGDMIPPELYDVVAEILVFVDDMDKLRGKVEGMKK